MESAMPRFVGPFSVPDPDADAWDEMVRQNRLSQGAADASEDSEPRAPSVDAVSGQDGQDTLAGGDGDDILTLADDAGEKAVEGYRWFMAKGPDGRPLHPIGHPGLAESAIPIVGFGHEALADYQEGHPIAAALNAGGALLEATGLFTVGADVAKLGFRIGRSQAWRQVRRAALEKGLVEPFQPAHHIVQQRYLKWAPDWLKNNWLNVKPMRDQVIDGIEHTGSEVHRRIHGRARVNGEWLPEFNFLQKLRYGAKPSTAAFVELPAGAVARPTAQAVFGQSDPEN
jgi:hypothetical protein